MKYRIVNRGGWLVKDSDHQTVFSPHAKDSRAACRQWVLDHSAPATKQEDNDENPKNNVTASA